MFVRSMSAAVFFMAVIFIHLDVTNLQVSSAEFGSVSMVTVFPAFFHAAVGVFAAAVWWRALGHGKDPGRVQQVSAAHAAIP